MDRGGVPSAAMTSPTPPLEPSVLLEHAGFVRALARSLVSDPGGADDIEQETWLRALQHGPRERSNLRGWLATVMQNTLRNRARERARRELRESNAARSERIAPSSLAAEQADTLRSLVGAVVALDEPYRSTVLSLYFQGLSSRELAVREGLAEATVRSRHQRALAKLREALDDQSGGRERWCSALAALTGLDTGAKLGVGALALGLAAAVAALIGIGTWWLDERPEASAPPVAASALESTSSAAATIEEARGPAQDTSQERREPGAGQIELKGSVNDLDRKGPGAASRPAAGARVSVRLSRGERGLRANDTLAETELVADETGAFVWSLPEPNERPLTFSAHTPIDGAQQAASAQVRLETSADRSAGLVLERVRFADVAMRIERDDGSAFAGALVRLLKSDNKTILERVSDEQGLARFEQSSNYGRFDVAAPGWTPVRYAPPKERADGQWDAGRIVMAQAGSLRVRVVDGAGAPIEDASVLVVRQPWERDLKGDSQWGASRALGEQSAKTDARGEARIEAVAANRDLRVRVVRGRQTLIGEQRSADGRLIGLEHDGLALRAPAGGELQVEARWSDRLALELELVRADGATPGQVELLVVDLGRSPGEERVVHDGRIDAPSAPVRLAFAAPELVGPLALFAREEQGAKSAPVGLGYAGDPAAEPTRVALARAQIELPRERTQLDDTPLRVALKLEVGAQITGTLIARDGTPARHLRGGMGGYSVRVVPEGASLASSQDLLHPQTRVRHLGESGFSAGPLAPGRYDLLVGDQIETFYTFASSVQRFGGIEAGASGVELRLSDPGLVKVRLATDAPQSEAGAGHMIALMGALTPRDAERPGTQRAERRQLVSALAPWPESAPRNFAGIGGGHDELGLWSFGCEPVESAALAELPELAPGWYVFGVHVEDGDGSKYAPAATKLAYYEAGEYALEFRLTPVADVHGRVRRSSQRLVALELVAPDGELVRFRGAAHGSDSTITRQFAPSDGVVRLSDVPHGRYVLRVGAPAQLDRGQFERTAELVVGAATAPFELDLR